MRILYLFFSLFGFGFLAAQPVVNLGRDTALCQGLSLSLNAANSGATYLWSTGASSQTISVNQTGLYSVTVTNAQGSASDTIAVNFLPVPNVQTRDTSLCTGLRSLPVQTDASRLFWFNAATGGQQIGSGSPLPFNVSSNTTVFAQGYNFSPGSPMVVGQVDTSFAGGAFYTLNNWGLNFNVLSPLRLFAVTVFLASNNGNPVNFEVRLLNSGGTVIRSQAFSLRAGRQRLLLDWAINPANGYRLVLTNISNGSAYINLTVTAQHPYPYTLPGLISITGDWQAFNNYTYFYNWEILADGFCASPRQPLQITAVPTPVLSLPTDTLSCTGSLSLDAGNLGATYLWSNGETTQTVNLSQSQIIGLTVSQSICSASQQIRAEIGQPSMVTVQDTTVCSGLTQLSAQTSAQELLWYNVPSGGLPLGSGSPVNLNLQSSQTLYAEGRNFTGQSYTLGQVDTSFAPGSFFRLNNWGLNFNALSTFRLYAVTVFLSSNNGNPVSFEVRLLNSAGATVQTRAYTLPAGRQRLLLNWSVNPGNGYRLVLTNISSNGFAYINTNVTAQHPYPYTIPGVISITGDWQVFNNYTYFYNWEILTGEVCSSLRQPMQVDVIPTPSFVLPNDTLSCTGSMLLSLPQDPTWQYTWSTGETTAQVQFNQSAQVGVTASRQNCSSSRQVRVQVISPPQLQNSDTTICSGQVLIRARGSGQEFRWYANQSTSFIAGGANPHRLSIERDSLLYVEALNFEQPLLRLGQVDSSFAPGRGAYFRLNNWGHNFEVFQALGLHSVSVYVLSNNGAPVTLNVRLLNGAGTVELRRRSLSLPTGFHKIELDWPLAAGTYRLVASDISTNGSLYINTNVAGDFPYPYTLPGLMQITSDWQPFNNYTYFYAWEISTSAYCRSPRLPVQVQAIESPRLNFPPDTLVCQQPFLLDAGNAGGTQYLWSTGSTNQVLNISQDGTYHLSVNRSFCSARDTIQVRLHSPPSQVQIRDTAFCRGTVSLPLLGNYEGLFWWADSLRQTPLGLGNPLSLNLQRDTVLYPEALLSYNGYYSLGLVDNQRTQAGAMYRLNNHGTLFETYSDFHLLSVTVYAGADNTRFDIELRIESNQVLQRRSLVLNQGKHIIWLNWRIQQPGIYQLLATNFSSGLLHISELVNSYPFVLSGVATLLEDIPRYPTDNFNYFYDWQIASGGYCAQPWQPLLVNMRPSPLLSLPSETIICGSSVDLDLSPGNDPAVQYLWQDGQTAAQRQVSQAGTWVVTASLGTCQASAQTQVYLVQPPNQVNAPNDTTLCGGLLNLSASGNAYTYAWYDRASGGTALGLGSSFQMAVSDSTTFWLEGLSSLLLAQTFGELHQGSPQTGAYIYAGSSSERGLRFDVYRPLVLDRLSIWVDGPGSANIVLLDEFNQVLASQAISYQNAGEQVIALDWPLEAGPRYRILLRDLQGSGGVWARSNYSFPLNYPQMQILRSEPSVFGSQYSYFFRWRLREPACPSPRQAIAVNVPPYPQIALPADTALCDQSSLSLEAAQANPNYSYLWSNGQTTAQVNLNQTGRYALTVTNVLCSRHHDIEVQFLQTPTMPVLADTLLCAAGQHLLLQPQPGSLFTWYEPGTGLQDYLGAPRPIALRDTTFFVLGLAAKAQSRLGPAQTGPQSNYSPFLVQTYFELLQWAILDSVAVYVQQPLSFDLVLSQGLGANSQELWRQRFSINQVGQKVFLPISLTLPPGQDYGLRIDSPSASALWAWENQPAYPLTHGAGLARLTGSSVGSPYHNFYDWHWSYGLASCVAAQTDSFYAELQLPLNLPDTLFACDTLSFGLNLPGAQSYQWSNGEQSAQILLAQMGYYALTVNGFGACTAVDSLFFRQPLAPALPPGPWLCGDTLRSIYTAPQASFIWSTGETTEAIQVPGPGQYSLEVRSPEGCVLHDTTSFTDILPLPRINLGLDRSLCAGDSLDAAYTGPGVLYLWSTGETTQRIHINQTGNYSVLVQIPQAQCQGQDTVNIQILPLPQANFTTFVAATPSSYAVGFTNTSQHATGGQYTWLFHDGVTSTFFSPFRNYPDSGCYAVTLIARNACGIDTLHRLVPIGVDSCDTLVSALPTLAAAPFRLYPNPNAGRFVLSLPTSALDSDWDLRLFNSLGQRCAAERRRPSQHDWPLDFSHLPPGLYYLQLDNGRQSQTIIWQRIED